MADFKDDLGRTVSVDPPVRRFVSLVPSLTETFIVWGAGDRLVGITDYCVLPKAETKTIPRIGGTKDPRIADIVDLCPDLVIANAEENRKEDFEALEAQGVKVWVTYPKTVADVVRMMDRLAPVLGLSERVESFAAAIDRERDHIVRRAAAPVRAAYLIWKEPWMSVNHDTYIHDVLETLGMTNVFADRAERYFTITLEELSAARPDVILLPSEPFPFAARHARELADALAFPIDQIRLLPGEDYCWFGRRTEDVFHTHRRIFG